jgi:2-methylaconitate cis-trans-isomerase PrpF
MTQIRIPAVFMRGGSSKGVFFKPEDMQVNDTERDRILLHALGSPDAYGRQLNGLGGGVSSVSKAVFINPSLRDDADVDYTFAQVAIDQPIVDYSTTCGNLSSAVGPFAIDNGMLAATGATTLVRVFNTNLGRIYHAHVPTIDGRFNEQGDFSIPGVSGTGSKIGLDYLSPGGASTGSLLPTGNVIDVISLENHGDYEVSCIDSSTACIFVSAGRFGLDGSESVEKIESNHDIMDTLEQLRRQGAVLMGLSKNPEEAALGTPKICLVAEPKDYKSLAGELISADLVHIAARFLSMGQVHRVLPLTGAMCLGTACQIEGAVASQLCRPAEGDLQLANPSGVLPVDADVRLDDGQWNVNKVTVYRTARAMMEGAVLVPQV